MENIDNQQPTTRRDAVVAKLTERYPDKSWDNDEDIYGQMSDDYDALSEENEGYKSREKNLVDMFSKDPRSASFLQNWRDGSDPSVELIRMYGDELEEALHDETKQEELAKANAEYVAKVAKNKELEDEYKTNMEGTFEQLKAYQEEKGLSDEEMGDAVEKLISIATDMISGKVTPDALDLVTKGINFEGAVADAKDEGEVKGRNAKIVEKLKKADKGDGIANLGSRAQAPSFTPRPDLGALGNVGAQDIFTRGGEKRIKKNTF